ncbi:hypothetical protein CFP56_008237 [Quercus suber]|uniref:Uncharacterized protein n=1 Tax=Quercus suber TaxID=58331 RepID=A0AAW0L5X2_QUESU
MAIARPEQHDRLVELWKYLLRVSNTFTCNVEAELHEIEIDSIDVTRKAEGCRRMHYYNGDFDTLPKDAHEASNGTSSKGRSYRKRTYAAMK